MRKTTTLLVIAVMLTLITGSAFALAPMGPPMSRLEQDQWSIGLEYEHSEMDIETSNATGSEFQDGIFVGSTPKKKYEINGLKSDMFYANLGFSIVKDWDMYLRLGFSDAKDDIKEIQTGGVTGDKYQGFKGSYGASWGIGTRASFYQEENMTLGALLQANWSNPGSSDITCVNNADFTTGEVELDYWEIQLAAGPTFDFDYFRIYGGPFLHFVYGNFDLNATFVDTPVITFETSNDIKESVQIGGYVGTQWYLTESSSLLAELQFTGDAWGLGLGVTWKF